MKWLPPLLGGFFLASQNSSHTVSSTRLTSPSLRNTADGCKLSFSYHLGRDDAWQLQVLLKTGNATQMISNVGSTSTGSKQWKKKYVTVGRANGPLQVTFSLWHGNSFKAIGHSTDPLDCPENYYKASGFYWKPLNRCCLATCMSIAWFIQLFSDSPAY